MLKASVSVFVAFLLCFARPAVAGACYSAEEIGAEHLLRFHSELMVITVTCKQASTGQDLGRAYARFTQARLASIKRAEGILVSHYEKTRKGKGINHLDVLRTRLANEIGQKVADESAPLYCGAYRDQVPLYAEAPPSHLEAFASERYAAVKPYEPACPGVKTAFLAKGDSASGVASAKASTPGWSRKKGGL